MERGVAALVGAGPGLGFSIARRFAREGYTVALLARTYETLEKLVERIAALERTAHLSAIRVDCSDPQSVEDAFQAVNSLGVVEVLVYNINSQGPFRPPLFMDINAETFWHSLAVSPLGAFHCVQKVLPGMLDRGRGTILFSNTAASIHGAAGFSEIACGKFALRALAQCLARELHQQGIHVVNIILDGVVKVRIRERSMERPLLDPDAVAEVYWQIHKQNPNAWTQELDLRCYAERF